MFALLELTATNTSDVIGLFTEKSLSISDLAYAA
jgi:hypothetical protein